MEQPMTVTIENAHAQLPELIAALQPNERMLIVQNGHPLATLTRADRQSWPCTAGSARDTPHWMADDFDAPLEEFREYME
jgi:antitoxin (DNA-binding transcriptional repressor) of toxin-antitoxin stability system